MSDPNDYDEHEHWEAFAEASDTERRGFFAGWGMSLLLHAAVVLVLGLVVVAHQLVVDEPPPVINALIEPVEPPPEPVDTPEITPEVVIDPQVDPVPDPIPEPMLEPEDIEVSSEDPVEEPSVARGEPTNTSSVDSVNTMEAFTIGVGATGGNLFGRGGPGGDKRTWSKHYGPHGPAARDMLISALNWLERHQSDDGRWDSDNYFVNCTADGPKAEPGRQVQGADEALTAYAVLCYLGAGYDHGSPNRFRRTVKAGVDWLVANQQPDGLIGKRNYEHAVATMALAEAYGMTGDPRLRDPAQRAVDVMLSRQAEGDGYPLGWDYTAPKPERIDTSVTGWNVMALKSAKVAGLDVGQGLEGAKIWLERSWKDSNPGMGAEDDPYEARSIFPYTWNSVSGATKKEHMSFAGAVCAVYLGHGSGDIILESQLNDMTARWLDTDKYRGNSYVLYYASLAAFQGGQRHWIPWRDAFVPWLKQTQITDQSCQDGTWTYPKQNFHGGDTSRVLIHCYQTLALEVAIRNKLLG